ncbi:MlaA family lipoprotein [Burkholderia multivorans]|uniref:MlaA family lipoprotein n=5 Tax=Burkholderia multivorans TaxID=87883 RepID=UPI000D00A948|nr:VacJ family lipoprotein [Burkholderia multivorans]MBR7892811.1 VacJ family lipoprotein [Burkholderia multivorans]MBR8453081.1 VacJ family lipoprotein [Burkholderia multivorans]MBU9449153.1 VacJ family lipoprotein [Burkholderia multivorans]MCL4644810.1 VacJ family lipoprotein [Burkholderia multivorans]PRG31021.1 ABC transporter [Burkholderia multivorans]
MQTIRIRHAALAAAAVAALSGCATVQTPTKGDPLEGFNRTMYKFNDTVDTYALKPVAKGYQYVVPQPVRDSVTNFFSNIGDVYIAANNLVQLRIADGVGDLMRVVINTVFGVGGLFDVATIAKLPKHTADFGITMGRYGVPSGPYLVLPLLGPSTLRDAAGLGVDYVGNPLTYVKPDSVSWGLYGVNLVNTRANLLGAGDVLDAAALDKYSFVRNAYLQRRQMLINNARGEAGAPASNDALPQYELPEDTAAPAAGAAGSAGAAAAGSAGAAAVGGAAAPTGASAAEPASGAAAPNPASATTVPPMQVTPPAPGGLRLPSFRLH